MSPLDQREELLVVYHAVLVYVHLGKLLLRRENITSVSRLSPLLLFCLLMFEGQNLSTPDPVPRSQRTSRAESYHPGSMHWVERTFLFDGLYYLFAIDFSIKFVKDRPKVKIKIEVNMSVKVMSML